MKRVNRLLFGLHIFVRIWALPLIAIIVILFISILSGSFALSLPLLLLTVWLVYALIKTRSRIGIAVTGGILVLIVVLVILVLRSPVLVESYFTGRYQAALLTKTTGAEWQQKTVGSFQLRYREYDSDVVKIESALTDAQKQVADFFKEVPQKTVVIVFPDLKSLEATSNLDLPDYGIGGGLGSMMVFTSPETWSAQTLAGTTVEQVVAHEFAHVVVNHLGGGMAPKWLNEGIAPCVAGQFTQSTQSRVIEMSAAGKLYSLSEVETYFRNPAAQPDKNAGLMYAAAASAMNYIIENHGKDTLIQVLTEMSGGKTADHALQSVFGMNRTSLEAAWLRSLI